MSPTTQAYICALSANLVFALAVQVFAYYSEKVSAIWMNWFKACVALVCFAAAVIIGGGTFDYSLKVSGMLFLSGVIGLAIGDLCLFAALKDLGPGRAMVLMAFHPLITGGLSYVFHGDVMAGYKIFAVIFMIACIVTFSLEAFKKKGQWHFKGVLLVLSAVCLDATAWVMIKEVESEPGLTVFEGNTFRALGAVLFLFLWSVISIIRNRKNKEVKPLKLIEPYTQCSGRGKALVIGASIMGTFLGLTLLFKAVSLTEENLAGLSSINVTCSIFAMLFECIHKKVWPSKYFYIAFGFMACGLGIFIFGDRIFG